MACDIFLIGDLAMCDSMCQRGARGQIWSKKCDIFLNGP